MKNTAAQVIEFVINQTKVAMKNKNMTQAELLELLIEKDLSDLDKKADELNIDLNSIRDFQLDLSSHFEAKK